MVVTEATAAQASMAWTDWMRLPTRRPQVAKLVETAALVETPAGAEGVCAEVRRR